MRRPSTFTIALLVALALTTGGVTWAAIKATPTTGQVTTPATDPPTPTTQPAVATTGGVVPTGNGPSAFTSTTAPGPFQLIVQEVTCVGWAGDGWRVRWRLDNHSPSPAAGPLAAVVDDSPPQLLALNLRLDGRASLPGVHTVTGTGESVSLLWAVTPSGRFEVARTVTSFPLEGPDCPTDPADLSAARHATSTT